MPDPWTGNHAPARAVPVFNQSGDGASRTLIADGPYVIAGRGVHAFKFAASDVRCGYGAPTRPIEMFGERRIRLEHVADRPDVVVRDRRGPSESCIGDLRARNDVNALLAKGTARTACDYSDGEQSAQEMCGFCPSSRPVLPWWFHMITLYLTIHLLSISLTKPLLPYGV
jgi:hypothetical protein